MTLTPSPWGGVSIHWSATWDDTLLGKMVRRSLRKVYPEVVGALVAAADDHAPST